MQRGVRGPRHRARAGLLALAVLLSLAFAESAFAEPAPKQAAPTLATTPIEPTGQPKHRLNWHYQRFRWWEFVSSASVTLTGFYLQYGIKGDFPDHDWHDGVLFDDGLRSTFRAGSLSGRLRAAKISDAIWPATQYYPVLVEGLLIPLATDRFNVDVALQMTLLNWQAEGLSFVLLRLAHHTVGRGRPHLSHCPNGPHPDDPTCNPGGVGNTASFYSGHSAMTAAAAGLSCAHNRAFVLYGEPLVGSAVCGTMIASALVTGALRVVADRHWTTDVMAGWLLGGAVGYGLPTLLHYRPFGAGVLPKHSVVVPHATDEGGGLTWLGLF